MADDQRRTLYGLEGATRPFPNLVQLVLKGVDLPFGLIKGGAFGGDEQASILGSRVAQEGSPDGSGQIRGSEPDIEFEGFE
jgi:hypothetical protein